MLAQMVPSIEDMPVRRLVFDLDQGVLTVIVNGMGEKALRATVRLVEPHASTALCQPTL